MTNSEKVERLATIGKHLRLLKTRYGFSNDPKLTGVLREVAGELKKRIIGILES